MAIYPVDLFEGNQAVTYEVEANSPEEAKQKAIAYREVRFQERTTREGLEQDKADLASNKERQANMLDAATLGFQDGVSTIMHGTGDALLNMGEGIASMWASKDDGASVQKIKDLREGNLEHAAQFAVATQASIAQRPLTRSETMQAVEDTAKFVKRGKFAADISIGIGTGAATLAAKSLPKMLMLGAAEGGLGGYMMADTAGMKVDEGVSRRINEAAFGAVLGTGLSTVPAALAGVKNWFGRKVVTAAGGREALDASRESLRRMGIYEVSPGQITGDPKLLLMEGQSAGLDAQRMFAGQMDQAIQGIGQSQGIRLPPMADLLEGSAGAIDDAMTLTRKTLGKMRGARNSAFEDSIDALSDMTGNAPIIPVGKLLDDTMDVVREFGDAYGASVKGGSLFSDTIDDIVKASQAGGLTARKANALLARFNAMQDSGHGMFDMGQDLVRGREGTFIGHTQKRAQDLKNSLMGSFDDATAGMPTQAAEVLTDARAAYGKASTDIKGFEDAWKTSVGMGGDPASLLKKLQTTDPARARAFVEGLREMRGGQQAIDRMNEFMVREAARKASHAKVGAGLREGDFDVGVFATELAASGRASRLKGLLLPEQEQALSAGLRHLRLLMNSPQFQRGVMQTQLPIDLQHIAINAVSQDPGFMSRVLAGALQRGAGVESLFFTRQGQDILFNATQFAIKAPTTAAATQSANATVAYLGSMIGAGEQLRQLGEVMRPNEQ